MNPAWVAVAVMSAAPLVELKRLVPDTGVDLRYGTSDNIIKQPVYPPDARCLVVPPLGAALSCANEKLRESGLRLVAWDCYRPLAVQKALWAIMPRRGYVADPRSGSHHNRGAAIDVTLSALDGGAVEVPTGFDEFSRAAHHHADGGTPAARRHRELLHAAMVGCGLKRNFMEWWHYELPDAVSFPLRDEPLVDAGAPLRDAGHQALAPDASR